jgi:predicted transcriptional regulator
MGRPSEFSSDAEAAIIEIIREGGTLDKAAEAAGVTRQTVCRWLQDDSAFRDKYVQAREDQGDWFADKIASIALDPERDGSDITARVNALKWLAGKRKPKVYGEKVVNEHGGIDGKPIETVTRIARVIVDPRNTDSQGVPTPAEPGEV